MPIATVKKTIFLKIEININLSIIDEQRDKIKAYFQTDSEEQISRKLDQGTIALRRFHPHQNYLLEIINQ